jgi:hypothetical protein
LFILNEKASPEPRFPKKPQLGRLSGEKPIETDHPNSEAHSPATIEKDDPSYQATLGGKALLGFLLTGGTQVDQYRDKRDGIEKRSHYHQHRYEQALEHNMPLEPGTDVPSTYHTHGGTRNEEKEDCSKDGITKVSHPSPNVLLSLRQKPVRDVVSLQNHGIS